ncbi:MAG: DNA-processing protein DprA [Tissierellales bacterium]|nr:DNA-processing protein DprA [Tissierellales bacterium]MBN2827970.1 DNA-processing protein DprA [Tissierellales bacterium]
MNTLDKSLMTLNACLGPNNILFEKIESFLGIEAFSNIEFHLEEIKQAGYIKDEQYFAIIKFLKEDKIDYYIDYMAREKINVCTIYNEKYPENLKNIENRPYILYVKSDLEKMPFPHKSIAVVGSRKVTSYGKWVAERLVSELSENGFDIISGMAYGIDSIAHETALKHHASTIAVLGSGADVAYPKRNNRLYEQIAESGAVISEFPLGTIPQPFHFPLRNRIISGLSDAILVIEAGEKSGSLITATYALEQGREVFAVPGNIDSIFSKGTNRLIREGAKITTSIDDILEEFHHNNGVTQSFAIDETAFSGIQSEIIINLKTGQKNILELNDQIACDLSELYSNLTLLELSGIIISDKGKRYRLVNI